MARSTPKQKYGNDSISALKGADRVRKRPGVIFGSDGLEGCEHAVFEILSNAIDEAREALLQKKSRQEHQLAQSTLARALNRLRVRSHGTIN